MLQIKQVDANRVEIVDKDGNAVAALQVLNNGAGAAVEVTEGVSIYADTGDGTLDDVSELIDPLYDDGDDDTDDVDYGTNAK